MALKSISECPWCGAQVEIRKQAGSFICPRCSCRFRHRWIAWILGIPLGVAAAIVVFQVVELGLVAVLVGVLPVYFYFARQGVYVILTEGKEAAGDNFTEFQESTLDALKRALSDVGFPVDYDIRGRNENYVEGSITDAEIRFWIYDDGAEFRGPSGDNHYEKSDFDELNELRATFIRDLLNTLKEIT